MQYLLLRSLIALSSASPLMVLGDPVANNETVNHAVYVSAVDSVAQRPLGVTVEYTRQGDTVVGATGADGVVSIDQFEQRPFLSASSPGELLENRRLDQLVARRNGYVSVSRDVDASEIIHNVQLTPFKSGNITSVISAEDGGAVSLPGVGLLSVSPGALSSDSALMLITLDPPAYSTSVLDYHCAAQYFLVALDSVGNPLVGNLLPGNGMVTLQVRASDLDYDIPTGASSIAWRSTVFGDSFVSLDQRQLIVAPHEGTPSIPLGEGLNVVEYDYRTVAEPMGGCTDCGPWYEVFIPEACWMESYTDAPFLCGVFIDSRSKTTTAGQTHGGAVELSAEYSTEVEGSVEKFGAKVSQNTGVKVAVNKTFETTESSLDETTVSVSATNGIDGSSPGQVTQPVSCLSGRKRMGVMVVRYKIVLERTCFDQDGEICTVEQKDAGTLTVAKGLDAVFDLTCFDNSCEGCEEFQEYPDQFTPPSNYTSSN